jgi:signal-transduction protein with cAMP-binding, CBS, and nucleotidyltransferase domain
MKSGIHVGDAMTVNPVSVGPDFSLTECAKVMESNHVGAVVVKSDGKTLGILTEQDIVRKAVTRGANTKHSRVMDFMEHRLITIGPAADIYDALVKMRDNNIRHLPVVQGNKMAGLLTIKDILKIEPQLFEIMVEKFELREESRKPINRIIPSEGLCEACGEYSEKVKSVKDSILCHECSKEQTMLV